MSICVTYVKRDFENSIQEKESESERDRENIVLQLVANEPSKANKKRISLFLISHDE